MIVYADTSALAKLLLDEPGTAEMQATRRDAEAMASVSIAYVELRGAMASAIRDRRIPAPRRDHLLAWRARLPARALSGWPSEAARTQRCLL